MTTDPTAAAPDLAAEVDRFLADEPDVELLGDGLWRMPFDAGTGEFSVFVQARGHLLLVFATRLEAAPPERVPELVRFASDINPQLTLSWFECQTDSGSVSARASLDTEGVAVDSVLIGNVVGAAVGTMGRFLPAIDALVEGSMDVDDFGTVESWDFGLADDDVALLRTLVTAPVRTEPDPD